MNDVKKNVKTISEAAEFSDIKKKYSKIAPTLHIWTTYIHFGNNLEFFPMERTEDDNFKKCWFLAASVHNYNSWGGLLYEVLTQIRKCDLCEKGETKYVCMYVSRSRTYHRRCISKREEMIWKKFREKNVWTLPDENYEDDGAGQQV